MPRPKKDDPKQTKKLDPIKPKWFMGINSIYNLCFKVVCTKDMNHLHFN